IYVGLWVSLSAGDMVKVHAVALAFLPPVGILTFLMLGGMRPGSNHLVVFDSSESMTRPTAGAMPKMATEAPPDAARTPFLFDVTRVQVHAHALGQDWDGPDAAPQPRVRELFPETMLWRPQLVTDDEGRASLDI